MKLRETVAMALAAWLAAASALADYPPEFQPVVTLFSGIAYADHDMIQRSTTDDFLLLEVGEVWDLATLLDAVTTGKGERKNYFGLISVERFDGVASISYWNKAVVRLGAKTTSRGWLESVIVVDTGSGWKLKQMHSTRVDAQAIPEAVPLSLYMLRGAQ